MFCAAGILLGAQFGVADSVIVALGGGLVLSLAVLSRTGGGLMSHPVLVYLGEISYSVYMTCTLWELVFANAAGSALHIKGDKLPLWLWLVFVAGTVPLAASTYHLIEKPARRWLRDRAPHKRGRGLKITPA